MLDAQRNSLPIRCVAENLDRDLVTNLEAFGKIPAEAVSRLKRVGGTPRGKSRPVMGASVAQ